MGITVPQTLKTFIQHKNNKAFEIHALTGPNNNIDIPDSSIPDILNISELRHNLLSRHRSCYRKTRYRLHRSFSSSFFVPFHHQNSDVMVPQTPETGSVQLLI